MTTRPVHSPAPVPPLLRPLAKLAAPVYLAELGRRNRRFDRGIGVAQLDRPVISVGNISVGGVGKTPMVMTIVQWLLKAGHRPCIAMRGYRSAHTESGESDEAALYRQRFGDVPVVAQPDRLSGLRSLFMHASTTGGQPIDCVVLDDGFQHRQIARDLDIVLLDASRNPFTDRTLPAGWLREPVSSLARAHAIVLTHAEATDAADLARIETRASDICPSKPIAITRHEWRKLRIIEADGGERIERPAWLVGRRAVAACAIGNPTAFLRAVQEATGAADSARGEVAAELVLRDHDPWTERTVSRLLALARQHNAEAIIVTAKDWTKLSRVERLRWPAPVVTPELEMGFTRGEEQLREHVLAAARM